MPNKNLHAAKTAKNDEFYTQLSDIEKELYHYRDFFRGKVVFCNCDDPEYSNFWKYFQMNFFFLGLKKLIGLAFLVSQIDCHPAYFVSTIYYCVTATGLFVLLARTIHLGNMEI